MRGKVWSPVHGPRASRITPAHAGKRDCVHARARRAWDHPRPCGEKFPLALPLYHYLGSPPPMRGKGFSHLSPELVCRITPAHAGKRMEVYHSCLIGEDHPRPCGEKLTFCLVATSFYGITPAHAGKSFQRSWRQFVSEDHPRPCGEKSVVNLRPASMSGSPPPMRGKGLPAYTVRYRRGITPAHAGKRL